MAFLAGAGTARAQTPPDSARVAPTLPAPEVRRWQTGALRADRLQHATLGFALAAGLGGATREVPAAFGATCALALLKECWDARHSRFDAGDLAASAAGAGAGALAAGVFER